MFQGWDLNLKIEKKSYKIFTLREVGSREMSVQHMTFKTPDQCKSVINSTHPNA
jgi:hypothetical protein